MSVDIEVKDLWKSFSLEGGKPLPIFEGIDMTVDRHEFIALVGPSGCGKTTLLNLLAGFDLPDRGTITVDGTQVRGPTRKGIMITQKGSVFPWLSAWKNVTFVLNGMTEAEKKRRAHHYIDLVGLHDFGRSFPYQLSGGMLQRLELARALVVKPEVLYMDEPFGALDALTRVRMRQELLRIRREEPQTTVLVTHDVDEAIALADRIFVLSERPMRIKRVVDINMEHPRSMADLRAVACKDSILRQLGVLEDDGAAGPEGGNISHPGVQTAAAALDFAINQQMVDSLPL
jgi:ABC-type nitrate/sulfonate/bicarbonate transport system ATPase subunit